MKLRSLVLDQKELGLCKKTIERKIKDSVVGCGSTGAIVGLSGGIDSSLVFCLAVNSGIRVHAMIMPEESVSAKQDVVDAVKLAEDANVAYSLIKINAAVNAFDSSFPWEEFDSSKRRVALGNAKARVRMVYDYLAANSSGMLVLGTGNRTEILLGYATKYGDGGVDIQPIGALYKSQVRQLASYVGIPQKIIDKVPTAGLWKGQTDEGELGASYSDMDRILYALVEEGKSVEEAAELVCGNVGLVRKLEERMERNEHKRCLPPVVGLFD